MPTEREMKRIRQRSAAGVCTTPGRAPIPPPVATSPLRRPLLFIAGAATCSSRRRDSLRA